MSVHGIPAKGESKQEDSKKEAIERLCAFLPGHVRRGIGKLLFEYYGDARRLAGDIGCGVSAVHAWAGENGSTPGHKYMPIMLSLALTHCPETRGLLKKEVLEAGADLCSEIGISGQTGEGDWCMFLDAVDGKSTEIIWHLWWHRHARLDELRELIGAPTDMEVLWRLREVINPLAEKIMGAPVLKFCESRIDPVTGKKILFNWWFECERWTAGMDEKKGSPVGTREAPIVDLFDERDHIVIVAQLPGGARVAKEAEVDCNNNMVKISLEKFQTKEAQK